MHEEEEEVERGVKLGGSGGPGQAQFETGAGACIHLALAREGHCLSFKSASTSLSLQSAMTALHNVLRACI